MNRIQKKVTDFFARYEAGFNDALAGTPDIEATAGSFTDCFIEANPFGVVCGKNNEEFRKAIPVGYAFYKSIGTKAMKIISNEINVLDEVHVMARVHWNSHYETKEGKKVEIDFNVIYFLQIMESGPAIFAYITGDEQRVLREHGLVPY